MKDNTERFYNTINLKQHFMLKAFLLGLGVSFCFFIPPIIYDYGYFLYYGDFNVQQVTFYQLIHDAIREGNIFWNFNTDLGANTIGSYSFYMLGSPFFWVTLLFPSKAVPYLMGPLLMLKFAFASMTAYIFIKRYVLNKNYAVIGGMLYAFSGFSVYNIFFNHFHEAIILLPLLLAALDEYVENKRRGLFAFAVFASCFVNYYFFVGQAVFCVIYFIIKIISKSYKISIKDFLLLLFEAIMGVLLSCALLIPTILTLIQNPRINNSLNDWNNFLYSSKPQRYIHIIESFFFPPDIPARPNFTPDSDAKWASVAGWLPLFSMSGVIAWITTKHHHWLKRILILLFFMSLIPVLNSAFQLFNGSYYARWFYIITLMASLATVMALESKEVKWKTSILYTFSITVIIAVSIGLFTKKSKIGGTTVKNIGLEEYPDRFWIYVAIAIISLLLLTYILGYINRPKVFYKMLIISVAFISFLYSIYIISLGKSQAYETHDFIIPYCLNQGEDINLPDEDEFSRIDVYEGMDNVPMFWGRPTIQAFHSIVPGSIMEFYPSIKVTRDVGSRPETDVYGVRALTSCRWLFNNTDDGKYFGGVNKDDPVMPGWKYYDYQNGFDVWENEYYIKMGFCYDKYITRTQYNKIKEEDRHLALLKGIVLEDDAVSNYSDILKPVDDINDFVYSNEEYYEDCKKLQQKTCSSFSTDNYGFSASITVEDNEDKLVFFSVPYENGFTATVNGQPANIEKVNVGFMAVRVPGGQTSDIRFNYLTPGLIPGVCISAISLVVILVYINISKNKKNKINMMYNKSNN